MQLSSLHSGPMGNLCLFNDTSRYMWLFRLTDERPGFPQAPVLMKLMVIWLAGALTAPANDRQTGVFPLNSVWANQWVNGPQVWVCVKKKKNPHFFQTVSCVRMVVGCLRSPGPAEGDFTPFYCFILTRAQEKTLKSRIVRTKESVASASAKLRK